MSFEDATKDTQEEIQMSLIKEESPVEKRLKEIDINALTPMESMNILFELIKMSNT